MLGVQGHDLGPMVQVPHGIVVSGNDVASFGINSDVAEPLFPVRQHLQRVVLFMEVFPFADGDAFGAEVLGSDPNIFFEVGHGDHVVECIREELGFALIIFALIHNFAVGFKLLLNSSCGQPKVPRTECCVVLYEFTLFFCIQILVQILHFHNFLFKHFTLLHFINYVLVGFIIQESEKIRHLLIFLSQLDQGFWLKDIHFSLFLLFQFPFLQFNL